MKLSKTTARGLVGGLSRPGKMPGFAHSIPISACITGGALQQIPGSVCSICYAGRNRYAFHNVTNAQEIRLSLLRGPRWIENMTAALAGERYFRWFDAGDLQGLWHLENIAAVADRTPGVMHWLPTREGRTVNQYKRKHGAFPANLRVRVSASMIDGKPPAGFAYTSTVHDQQRAHGYKCPSLKQGNSCRDCRACWSNSKNISYAKH